ncbi:WD40 repeat domain-containing protein [Streptomyces sp. VNUA116]|uniref:WD40 repeat domain-containing protein n=1 Tax=Streptomyces sp. VNUA116 TaxID=3062449 RepID=UPI00267516E6|nr:WD40 repeat domain-containing protein [Streptomyces sp. VNUA116]WKU42653.1 WD40 repeat domain-containing protein [Streptomyces sp. VNUA116]
MSGGIQPPEDRSLGNALRADPRRTRVLPLSLPSRDEKSAGHSASRHIATAQDRAGRTLPYNPEDPLQSLTLPDKLVAAHATTGQRVGVLVANGAATGPEEEFRTALRRLHLEAGEPSLREISRRIGKLPVPEYVSHDAVHRILSGPRLPRWPRTALVVTALGGNPDRFHQLWIAAKLGQTPSISSRPDRTVAVPLPVSRKVLTHPKAQVLAMACGYLDGRLLAVTGHGGGAVHVWDVAASSMVALEGHRGAASAWAVACTDLDGRLIAVTGGGDCAVRLWDLTGHQQIAALEGHTGTVLSVACTQLGGRAVAVTGSSDCTLRLWDLAERSQIALLTGHTAGVPSITCARLQGRAVAVSGGEDCTVRVWDLAEGIQTAVLEGHTNAVGAVACGLLEERLVAVTGGDRSVRVWDLATCRELSVLQERGPGALAVTCVELEGRLVVIAGTADGNAQVWDLPEHRELGVLPGHHRGVTSVACTQFEGRLVVVTGSSDGSVRVWDLLAELHNS